MFKNSLFGIRSLFMPFNEPGAGDGTGVSNGGSDIGAGVDVSAVSGKPVPIDAAGIKDGDPGAGNGGEEPFSLQIGDDVFSEEQVLDAISALRERDEWQRKLNTQAEDLSIMARTLEENRLRFMGAGQPQAPTGQPAAAPTSGLSPDEWNAFRTAVLEDNPDAAGAVMMGFVQKIASGMVSEALYTSEAKGLAKSHFNGAFPEYEETLQSPNFRQFAMGLPRDPHSGEPLYNPVNAFLVFKLNEANKLVEQARKEGFKGGQEDARKNIDSASRVRLLRGGGVAQPTPQGKSVKEMSHGEMLRAATQSILKMREVKGG